VTSNPLRLGVSAGEKENVERRKNFSNSLRGRLVKKVLVITYYLFPAVRRPKWATELQFVNHFQQGRGDAGKE